MKKPQIEPAVYLVLADVYLWRGKRHAKGARFEVTPSADKQQQQQAERKLQYAATQGEIRVVTAGDPAEAAPVPAAPKAPRPENAPPALESIEGLFRLLDPAAVAPSPVNPRKTFDEESLAELTESVREKGVRVAINVRPIPPNSWYVEPGERSGKSGWFVTDRRRFYKHKDPFLGEVVNYHTLPHDLFENFYPTREDAERAVPRWEIIAGERRWRAARRAGRTQVRAIIEDMDDEQAAELQVIENDQREDLSPLEAAAGYQHLLNLPGYTMAKLAQRVGKKETTLYAKLKLLDAPEPVQQAVMRDEISAVAAARVGRLDEDLQARFVRTMADHRRAYGAEEKMSDRDAKDIIDDLRNAKAREDLQAAAAARALAAGYTVLTGESARGVMSYGDTVAHNGRYVAVGDPCPRDPHGATWQEIVEQSEDFMRQNHLCVCRYAVIAQSHRDGYKPVPVFSRDQVNRLLKALGLWDAEGSQAAKEKEAKASAKERHGIAREEMMRDLDAIRRHVERESSPRRALLAAVWAATDDYAVNEAVEFVAKRRAWISLDDESGEANRIVRSLASDLEVRELQALVVELSIAQMGEEQSYFADSREEIRGLVEMDEPESVNAHTEDELEEVEA